MMAFGIACGGVLKLRSEEGKGLAGCLSFLLVLVVVGFAAAKIWPEYYACKSLDTDVRTEVSRAGANFLSDETLMKDILNLATRNEVKLTNEQVKIERFAGQINVVVHFTVPIDLFFFNWDMSCDIKATSFVGRL